MSEDEFDELTSVYDGMTGQNLGNRGEALRWLCIKALQKFELSDLELISASDHYKFIAGGGDFANEEFARWQRFDSEQARELRAREQGSHQRESFEYIFLPDGLDGTATVESIWFVGLAIGNALYSREAFYSSEDRESYARERLGMLGFKVPANDAQSVYAMGGY